MRIRKSELKELVQEVLGENEMKEAGVAKQKGVAKGARSVLVPMRKRLLSCKVEHKAFPRD